MITSLANKTIKDAAALKKPRERKKNGLILIDGSREIEMALCARVEIISLFYCLELIADKSDIFNLVDSEKRIEVSAAVFKKICYKENPDGFLAIARPENKKLSDLKLSAEALVVVLENIEKPGNLGGIIRTAYAAGVEAIIINSAQTDIYNPNVIRASEGHIFKEDIASASIGETIKWLKKNKIKSFGAATIGAKIYTEVNLRGRVAMVLGSEAEGLSKKWLEEADKLIKIPMKEGIDSLNVSVAAGIIIYEALRQRTVK
ncbi:MAG: RNA methyltransferase [Candidatus Falkowbacteria bacterium]|nr:RNA methyltransferase [Candidatus Falkowbacteria bacterium]